MDANDCVELEPEDDGESECAPGCPPSWPGDGICDDDCNNEACEMDAGD